jgi:hypothetical protein
MINRGEKNYEYSVFEVSCDNCSTGAEDFEALDWGDLMDQMTDAGWTKSSASGKWEHFCPDCQ